MWSMKSTRKRSGGNVRSFFFFLSRLLARPSLRAQFVRCNFHAVLLFDFHVCFELDHSHWASFPVLRELFESPRAPATRSLSTRAREGGVKSFGVYECC